MDRNGYRELFFFVYIKLPGHVVNFIKREFLFFCLFAPLWNASLFRTWEDSDRCKRKWKVKGQVWSLYPSFSCFCILNNNNNLERRKEKKHDDRMKRTVYRENYLQRLALLWKKKQKSFSILYAAWYMQCNGKAKFEEKVGHWCVFINGIAKRDTKI